MNAKQFEGPEDYTTRYFVWELYNTLHLSICAEVMVDKVLDVDRFCANIAARATARYGSPAEGNIEYTLKQIANAHPGRNSR